MSFRQSIVEFLEPKATWKRLPCLCGHVVTVPSALGGRRGTCPACFRPFVTPGERTACPRASRAFEVNHPEREVKRVLQEPNFAHPDSGYSGAQRHSMVPGALYVLATLGLSGLVMRCSSTAFRAIGSVGASKSLVPLWLLALWMVVATCTVTSVAMFERLTGKDYTANRVVFAAAGGYDVARWVPLLTYLAAYAAWHGTAEMTPDPLALVRGAWRFLVVCGLAAHVITGLATGWVLSCRFDLRTVLGR